MPVVCAGAGCNNTFVKGSEIRFYRFPISKPLLASQWVQSLRMKEVPTANTCLCSEHFRPDCFRDYNGKQFLREDAVPLPTHLVKDQNSSRLELRKRGPQLTVANKPTSSRGGRGGGSGGRGGGGSGGRGGGGKGRGSRGGPTASDKQNAGSKNKVYDASGRLISCHKDMCDCLDVDCMGCFFPCPECTSRKCGVECRCNRKWLYEQVEVEGGEILRNKYAN